MYYIPLRQPYENYYYFWIFHGFSKFVEGEILTSCAITAVAFIHLMFLFPALWYDAAPLHCRDATEMLYYQ